MHKPAVVYNPTLNQYLVATPGNVGGEYETYVQRLDANGVEIGTDDERISHMGPDGAPDYGLGVDVAVGYSPNTAQYLVTWHGDTTAYGFINDESEVFGQGLDANGKNSRIRVTARHTGYKSRYVRYSFRVRKGIGLVSQRVGSGCQTPGKPVRNVSCAG